MDSLTDFVSVHAFNLLESVASFYADGLYADLRFVTGSGHVYHGHRIIAASVSAMIKEALSGLPEDSDPLILLPDSSESDLNALLNFMYLGTVDIDGNNIHEVRKFFQALNMPDEKTLPLSRKDDKPMLNKRVIRSLPARRTDKSSLDLRDSNRKREQKPRPTIISRSQHGQTSVPSAPAKQVVQPPKTSDPDRTVICQVCTKAYRSKDDLALHDRIQHSGEMSVEPLKCPRCHEDFKRIDILRDHIAIHLESQEFPCPRCTKAFTDKATLKRHLDSAHDGKVHCKFCSKLIVLKRLGDHIKHVREDKAKPRPIECTYCSHTCSKKSQLINHMRTHTKERPFKCDECGKTFSYNHILLRHKRFSHQQVRAFKCGECGKGFFQKNDLEKHQRSHSGVKPYPCDLCSRSFARVDYLKKHMTLHNPLSRKDFVCETCNMHFVTAETLRRHQKQSHQSDQIIDDTFMDGIGIDDVHFEFQNIEFETGGSGPTVASDGGERPTLDATQAQDPKLQTVEWEWGNGKMLILQNCVIQNEGGRSSSDSLVTLETLDNEGLSAPTIIEVVNVNDEQVSDKTKEQDLFASLL